MRGWVIGLTGASGAIYGVTLIQELLSRGYSIHLIITEAGWRVLHEELDWQVNKREEVLEQHFGGFPGTYTHHFNKDIGSSVASGSFRTDGMVIIPCSMGTLSGIAHGASDNLLERTADVMLKEGRKLILVPRETPLHAIHLENMLKLSKMGTRMIPAMPAFYHRPQTLEDIVRFLVGKVLDNMGIEHELFKRWGESDEH
ncbi:phenolic acid decarboxylase subunit B [Paenibacillus larvae subsp. larvae]|uniref:Flavin prenyltransferase UbiX n=1 Tax=Paenibacillus larvae subsp. larvae TaxID=147375 RepID=A0A2L1TYM2_9BACL|nr:flavin prenyltransferase UbiX [Paenibacillus larvae]AQT86251.1 aromatic acid decarboxylase [Paenibacillus larvae subsp. pulvifaciens]AQZ47886.1 aromatic acid decarboxylase [Paenibacillus larvae subsp. pulvifaciens]AVF25781.1 phenolic acid decarboxylase subunit B [Paenibacillus larvae subsp. larvae]AVF30558.1 phenolic acid decarboxylase subunit B [Paenibacillus larvae subsp. larvae]MBH0341973.1 aromatic acid decarboxylase [Paenibacillus larvae]